MNFKMLVKRDFPIRQIIRHWHNENRNIPKAFKKDIVPIEQQKPGEPVSGSWEYGDIGTSRKFKWEIEALTARGFLRFQKEYKPPSDARETVISLARSIIPQLKQAKDNELFKFKLSDPKIKFQLLSEAFTKFDHSIPNSMLHVTNNIGDVLNFYITPIKTTTPYDDLVNLKDELPPNLHVQKEPMRFHPDTDTMFGGVSAYPKSSTVVTGLRSKKKYQGYEAKKSWV